ncbi:MAG: hypothetical protein RIB63_20165, partial [Fulvivirga sp.]
DPEKQKQYESGGLTMDATGAENNTTILAIAPSPVQKDIIWVGTDDGYVQITRDGGKSWTNVTSKIPGMPKAGWVAQITASTYNAGEAFVIVNNYRNFDYKPYLFHTTDFGNTWTNMVNESQVWNYTLSFIQDPLEPKLMFLGSEGGLYVSFDGGANWNKWEEGYSSVPTMDMAIHPREHDLVIGTYGRAAYVLDDIRPLRAIAKQGTNSVKNTLDLYDTPDAYITLNQQPSGTRFGADAIFNGENRNRGAMITYLVNKPEKKKEDDKPEEGKGKKGKKNTSVEVKTEDVKKDEVKYDSVILTIYNSKNELIRTLKSEVPKESGVHRMYWRLDEKGVNGPSRRVPEKNAPERSGSTVLPGQYKLKMAFGDKVDSTMITVKYDPRVNMTMAVLKAQYDFDKKIEASSEKAGKATARLAESKEILEDFTKRMKE